jgi:hypothetical protein
VNASTKCSFLDCDKPLNSRSLCHGHYQQLWRGENLRTLWTRNSNASPDGRMCNQCSRFKPWAEFYGKRSRCKVCFRSPACQAAATIASRTVT